MGLALNIKSKQFVKKLGKKANRLQIVAADTLNESTEVIEDTYKEKLERKAKLRNKFSLGSVKIFKANPISKSGEPRPLHRINAVVGIRKQKGGKTHYLAKLEKGGTTRGNPQTLGKVPIPLAAARIGKNDNRAVARGNRLISGKTQTLRTGGGAKIGVRNDAYKSTGQRWSVLYRAIRTGKIQGDPKKPFYMIGNNNELGVFKMMGKRIRKIRNLDKTSVNRKPEPHFMRSVKKMPPAEIQRRFVRNAKRKLGR